VAHQLSVMEKQWWVTCGVCELSTGWVVYPHTSDFTHTLAFAHMLWHTYTQILWLEPTHFTHGHMHTRTTHNPHKFCRDPMGWNIPSSLGTG